MRLFKTLVAMPWLAQLALVIILLALAVVVAAPVLAPYGEAQIVGSSFQPWGDGFLLGTDGLGRDFLSRLIYGIRNTVGIALVINCLAFAIGSVLGATSAALGGAWDLIIGRIVDGIMAIPSLICALLILATLGSSLPILIGTITLLDATRFFRVSRSVALNVVAMEFLEVARLRGEGLIWCISREILPNISSILMAEFGIRFCYVILFVSGLSFLGLGIQPPTADLGSMVRENSVLITFGSTEPLLPAAAIALLAVSVNFLVDWFLDQKQGRRR